MTDSREPSKESLEILKMALMSGAITADDVMYKTDETLELLRMMKYLCHHIDAS